MNEVERRRDGVQIENVSGEGPGSRAHRQMALDKARVGTPVTKSVVFKGRQKEITISLQPTNGKL